MVLPDREVRFQLSPDGLYYIDAADRENIVPLIDTVSENREGFTRREYEGGAGSAVSNAPDGVPVRVGP